MILRWLCRRRRKKLLAQPFPSEWEKSLDRLPFHRALEEAERSRLRDILRIIIFERNWEGCGGQDITDEVKLTIAAQAALLILNIEHDYYRRVESILVYPTTFKVPDRRYRAGGMVAIGDAAVLGLAQRRGPVVLAWDSVIGGVEDPRDGRNVVYHEFAHKLDMLDGWADGTPPLQGRDQFDAWVQIMSDEYERLKKKAAQGRPTLLDKYGATDPAEFFAVATECFFEKPRQMESSHSSLYDQLRTYYRQDPSARVRRKA